MKGGALVALVKYGAGIVQMSGSIAGDVHARNKSGNYIRPRTKPINPNTELQVRIRSIITWLSEYWSDTLTVGQRALWNVYAANVPMKNRLGETINLSGFNHFIRSNTMRKWFNMPIAADGPVIFTLADKDVTNAIDVDAAPQNIAVTLDNTMAWANETFAFMFMRQGLPQNHGRSFFGGPYHMCLLILGGPAPPASPTNVLPHYAVAVGQEQWCAFRISRADGRLSEIFYAHATTHGQAPGEVPMLIGLTQPEAEVLLTNAQLVLGEVTTANDDVIPVDHIISSDPVAHTMLDPGAAVAIVISLGPSA